MNILKMTKDYFVVNVKELLTIIGATLGGGVFGMVLAYIIGILIAHENYATVGTMMGLIFGSIILFFGLALGGQADFKLAVSMNRTRMSYVVARYLLSVVEIASMLVLTQLIQKFEVFLGTILAPGTETEILGTLSLQLILILTFVGPLVIMFFSIMYVMFDKKFFWVMWGVYMLGALGIPRISSAMKHNPESAAAKIGFFFQNAIDVNSVQFLITSIVLAVCLVIGNILLYRKTQVDI